MRIASCCLVQKPPQAYAFPWGWAKVACVWGRGFDGRRTLAQDRAGLSFVSRTGLRDAEGGSIQDYSEVISRLQARLNVRRGEQR